MPNVYQNYLNLLLEKIKNVLDLQTLTYVDSSDSDIVIKSYGLSDNFQRLLFKIGFSKLKSLDIKVMNKYDIVHIQHSYLWAKIIPLITQKNRPKIVITLRGGDTYMRPWLMKSWRKFYKESNNNIDAFITMSNHQKKYLTRWGVDENKIHVIPISHGYYSTAQPKYPNNNTLKLVSAYRMTWEKNIEGTIRFAMSLKEKNIPFIYDIYGDGADISQLYYLIDRFGLGSNINVKGKIDNLELKSNLVNYDFFVQLSISESLSASVIEAQSKGVPCIISNSDGLPEAVIQNKSGIIGDYDQIEYIAHECIRIFNDKDLYFSFSDNAIKNANENFSVEKETERLIKLYESLIINYQ